MKPQQLKPRRVEASPEDFTHIAPEPPQEASEPRGASQTAPNPLPPALAHPSEPEDALVERLIRQRIQSPKFSVNAFIDHDLYEAILRKYPEGLSEFIREGFELLALKPTVAFIAADQRMSDRRKRVSSSASHTVGCRISGTVMEHLDAHVLEARSLGIPRVSRATITNGAVMLNAEAHALV